MKKGDEGRREGGKGGLHMNTQRYRSESSLVEGGSGGGRERGRE